MSFLTDPNLYEFDTTLPENTDCFLPGETPTTLFFSIVGVLIGDAWTPSDPPPPNGFFELTHFSKEQWSGSTPDFNFQYLTKASESFCAVFKQGGPFFFLTAFVGGCLTTFESQLNSPVGNVFYSGKLCVLNPLKSGDVNNIEFMEKLNIDQKNRNFCQQHTPALNQITTRYTQRLGKTNILINYDLT